MAAASNNGAEEIGETFTQVFVVTEGESYTPVSLMSSEHTTT